MTPRELAREHLKLRRAPVPVRGKTPWDAIREQPLNGWPTFTATEDTIATAFGRGVTGVGVLNGERSGDLVDVDNDTPEAIAAAPHFLPKTACIFGRPGARRSHYEYLAPGLETVKFRDPKDDVMLLELRSTGSQTVWPGSLRLADENASHDELIAFDEAGQPASVNGAALLRVVQQLAVCTLLARHWPSTSGSRHEIALAAAGTLLRARVHEDDVETIVGTAARIAGDEEHRSRARDARTTARRLIDGATATGGPTLASMVGEIVVQRLLDWLRGPMSGSRDFADDNSEPWGNPIPLASLPVPPFPVAALPPVLHDLVEDIARVVQVPADVPGLCVVGAVAAAGARRAVVSIGNTHEEPLNLYVATVLGSGERKGPAIRPVLEPFYREQDRLRGEAGLTIAAAIERRKAAEKRIEVLRTRSANEETLEAREQILQEIDQLAAALPSVPPKPTLIVSDRTPEKLEMDLAEQGGAVLMASEEAGTLFEIAGGRYSRDGGTQLDTLLKAYDGGEIDTGRVSRENVSCSAPALSIIVTPQPIVLETLRERPEFHHRGFLPRFAWACPQSLVGYRPHDGATRPDQAVRAAYAQCVTRILALPRCAPDEVPRLRIEKDTLARWIAYNNRLEREMREDGWLSSIREWASKHAGRVARIAGSFHLVLHGGLGDCCVAPATMDAAIAVGTYLEAHALAAYDQMRADSRVEGARKVLAWVHRQQERTFTARAALTALRGVRTMMELEPMLALLIEYGYLRPLPPAKRSGPGRPPSPIYEVNPVTLGRDSAYSADASERGTGAAAPRHSADSADGSDGISGGSGGARGDSADSANFLPIGRSPRGAPDGGQGATGEEIVEWRTPA